jgi:hypothetical protein
VEGNEPIDPPSTVLLLHFLEAYIWKRPGPGRAVVEGLVNDLVDM